jgi:large subunit ribosomal protein L29
MKAADLREKGADDLRELHKTLTRDVFENRLKNFTNRLDDTSAIRKTRRDLARVNTLLREREAAAKLAATPAPSPAPVVRAETAAPEAAPAKKKAAAPKKAAAAKKAADAGVATAEAASTKKAAAKRSEAK